MTVSTNPKPVPDSTVMLLLLSAAERGEGQIYRTAGNAGSGNQGSAGQLASAPPPALHLVPPSLPPSLPSIRLHPSPSSLALLQYTRNESGLSDSDETITDK